MCVEKRKTKETCLTYPSASLAYFDLRIPVSIIWAVVKGERFPRISFVGGLTRKTSAFFPSLYDGNLTLVMLTCQVPNFRVSLPHRRGTTVATFSFRFHNINFCSLLLRRRKLLCCPEWVSVTIESDPSRNFANFDPMFPIFETSTGSYIFGPSY